MPNYKRKRSYRRHPRGFKDSRQRRTLTRTFPNNDMSHFISRFNPFPNVHYAELRYCQTINISIGNTLDVKKHFFSANSIYDPNKSATLGGQPYGHDQYQLLYNHYKVLESYITMTPMGPTTSNTQTGGAYGITLEDQQNTDVTFREISEKKGSTIAPFGSRNANTTGKLSRSYNCKYFNNNSRLEAQFGSNPLEQMYFGCFIYASANANNVNTQWIITINYKCKFWELRDLGTSSL